MRRERKKIERAVGIGWTVGACIWLIKWPQKSALFSDEWTLARYQWYQLPERRQAANRAEDCQRARLTWAMIIESAADNDDELLVFSKQLPRDPRANTISRAVLPINYRFAIGSDRVLFLHNSEFVKSSVLIEDKSMWRFANLSR